MSESQLSSVLLPLRLRLLGVLAASAFAVALLLEVIDLQTGGRIAFISMSGLVIVSLVAFTWSRLSKNRRPASESASQTPVVLPRFGWGTTISLGRAVVLGLLAGFLLVPRPAETASWWPALLYTVFVIADFLDGFVARRTDMATELGASLDVELDALGTLIAVVLAISYGNLPAWYLLLGLARYAFMLGLAWRSFFGLPTRELPPSRSRRLVAGFQMGFLSAALWPILPAPGLRTAAIVFGALSLGGFVRDWLVASTLLDPASSQLAKLRSRMDRMLTGCLPLARALVAGFVLARCVTALAHSFGLGWWQASASSAGAELARQTTSALGSLAPWALIAFLLAGLALLFGFLASTAALVLTLLFALELSCCAMGLSNQLPLILDLLVMILGPGALALYSPEGELLRAQHGRPRASRA